ncbi:conserved Plasmodium protein, unknown function [Plasmodium knowlesi strain H]|uniref:Uncharacterized protein n=3 Tax=Plasmodium knowlesi TaxID=5850 RepID=A0A5K1V201_PLAKH|nr:conserved Plasmodium protein, unknown function [Plasmodium knowlesi strain H]OTN63681.1 Uncharacterized protein PKNOH_S140236100 [Plasmodium knowlesi]CAA9990783.1 conserved Plasmodium protein, unknown function [Plasmodium knowlesi strain H]SBO21084.1 conserved Plasmodium protein, unknown function [Plasmodium knowlesi strain H]SBO21563.1 conserved Plasmodium protein, unknown function [Plasmodium knowlesi strain H]VVS80257.1 conserved Plasmodium protein, unknown function [Plasmodium knowlesi |eukprot:XP_002262072.1 hypothetical protein, conserved in Plasmodium species [Plasmodium knowlesi strain H]
MEDETENNLVGHVLSELEMSREYIRGKFKGTGKGGKNAKGGSSQTGGEPTEVYKNYDKILTCIEDKIAFYKNLNEVEKAKRGHAENGESRPTEQPYQRTAKRRDNFFEEYEKNKSSLQKMKKKTIAGYTEEGNAIIINNDKFCKMFINYNLASDRKNGVTDSRLNGTVQGGDDLSELSCSSSSVVSLHSFVKSEKTKRIRGNREAYIRHKYHDHAFVNHKLYPCSDCSSSSFSWYSDDYDDLFYYSNLLKEDKGFKKCYVEEKDGEEDKITKKKKDTQQCKQKKNKEKHIKEFERDVAKESPFYNYIYFKLPEKDKSKAYPIFVNTINGKKKMYNLKKICRNTHKKNYNHNEANKYELDETLFSYKKCKLLPSVKNETNKKGNHPIEMHSDDVLRRKHFDSDDVNYAIDKIIHQMGKISSSEKEEKRKFNHSDNFNNILNKNKEFLKREKNFTFQKLCETEKIRLKVKIIGTDGRVIKNKSLDNVLINKNKTFGDLATHLGHSFKLPKDKIENIKMYFDGDLCDKDLTFDNEELGLEDGFQIDVKFPLSEDNVNKQDEADFSDDNYVLYLPDSYVID